MDTRNYNRIGELNEKQVRRFWDRVDKRGSEECWEWKELLSPQGYGRVGFHGKSYPASRVAYSISNPGWDQTLCVLHRCDNPACCNPGHLWAGTLKENIHDCLSKGRFKIRLTNEEILAIKETRKSGARVKELANLYMVNRTTIWKAIHDKLSMKWRANFNGRM